MEPPRGALQFIRTRHRCWKGDVKGGSKSVGLRETHWIISSFWSGHRLLAEVSFCRWHSTSK